MKELISNYDFWAAIIGFCGVLIPTISTSIIDSRTKKKISLIESSIEANDRNQELNKRINSIGDINELKKYRASHLSRMTIVVFTILTISFGFQLLGVIIK